MKHLLVLGGTKGLGRAFIQSLPDSFTNVTVIARSIPSEALGRPTVRYLAGDALDSKSLNAAMARSVAEGGPLDGLALFQQHRGAEKAWENKLACTLTATRTAIQFFAENSADSAHKAIVLLSSIASHFACEEQDDAYHAAKTGLLGLCRYYAVKLGSQGVRVNCVSAGTILKEESQAHYAAQADLQAVLREVVPLRRMGTASEVASAVRFLLSPEASFITGQELVVDGGAGLQSQESLGRALLRRFQSGALTDTGDRSAILPSSLR